MNRIFLACVLLCASLPAHAILWTLTTSTGQSGTFDYGATSNTYSSINIVGFRSAIRQQTRHLIRRAPVPVMSRTPVPASPSEQPK
jgi:hypothetical protein